MQTSNWREKLSSVLKVDLDTAEELCRVALRFLQEGSDERLVEKAARKLEWHADELIGVLTGLMNLFCAVVQEQGSKGIGHQILLDCGLNEECCALVAQFITDKEQSIIDCLRKRSSGENIYKALEWRLETTIASRAAHHQNHPHFLMKLELRRGSAYFAKILQLNIPTMLHLTQQIEKALAESKSSHVKKSMRRR